MSIYDVYGICGHQATIIPPIIKQPVTERTDFGELRRSAPKVARKSAHRTMVSGFRSDRRKRRNRGKKGRGKRWRGGRKKSENSHLFDLKPEASTEGISECDNMSDIDSCDRIDVNFDVLEEELDLTLMDDEVVFKHSYTAENDDGTVTYSYQSDDMDSALFLYSESSGYPELDGSFTVEQSKYIIDNCMEDCHVLIKLGANRLNSQPEPEPKPSLVGKLMGLSGFGVKELP